MNSGRADHAMMLFSACKAYVSLQARERLRRKHALLTLASKFSTDYEQGDVNAPLLFNVSLDSICRFIECKLGD